MGSTLFRDVAAITMGASGTLQEAGVVMRESMKSAKQVPSVPNRRFKILSCALLGLGVLLAALLAPATALAQDDETLITATSVGGVDIGTTIDELRTSLDEYQISDDIRLTADLRGHLVSRDGRVAFRAAQVVTRSPQIELFIVSGEMFRTAEGVGPGTSISDAAKQYGKATFMLDRNNSGREFVVFADQPDGPIAFRTYGIAGAYVGEYSGDSSTTSNYQDDAAIASVWIGCTSVKACIRSGAAAIAPDQTEDDSAQEAAAAAKVEAERAEAERAVAAAEAERAAAAAEAARAEEERAEGEAMAEAARIMEEETAARATEQAATQSAASEDSSASAESDQVLAKTGVAQTRQVAIVALLMLFGVSMLLLERRYGLGPQWLR